MLFYYTVAFLSEDTDSFHSHTVQTEHGIISAKNYGKAVNRVVEYYGKNNIIEISIYELENPLPVEDVQELDEF